MASTTAALHNRNQMRQRDDKVEGNETMLEKTLAKLEAHQRRNFSRVTVATTGEED